MDETKETLSGSQEGETTLSRSRENGLIAREQIDEAAARIADWIRLTPVLEVDGTDLRLQGRVCLKLELLQRAGSFKARGAFNRILSANVPPAGVIAASGGNHGAAVAYAARALGTRAEIYLPEATSRLKMDRIQALGARVVTVPGLYADALDASLDRAHESGALVVHAFDQPEVVAGQGTLVVVQLGLEPC